MKLSPALRFLSNQVWAIHPPVFEALSALLESRANGDRSAAEFVERADGSIGTAEPAPQIVGNTGVVQVRGVIARYADQINGSCQDAGRSAETLQRDLLALAADPRVQRIVLRLDSPGGTVAGTSETADTIRQVSAGGKPVIAYVDGMAASAAYWLASQADEIVMAGPTSEVGSIGVITAHVDATRAQEARGFKVSVFRTSPLKAPGAMGETLTREQAAAIDRDLKDFHAVFAGAVQAGRGLTDEQVTAATTGEMWRPTQAIAMGLADRVATWEQVVGGSSPIQIPGAHRSGDTVVAGTDALNPAVAPKAQANDEESPVDTKLMATLAALCQAHPTHAAAIVAEANRPASPDKPAATPDSLSAFASAKAVESKDAEIADLKTRLSASEKARGEEKTRADKAQADHDRLAALAKGAPQDPGPSSPESAKAKEVPRADYEKNPSAYANDLRLGKIRLIDG